MMNVAPMRDLRNRGYWHMEIVRVYLDQKDFSRIGKGLAGNPLCREDVEVFRWLLDFVRAGRVRVYFSWCHAVETLRYDEDKIDVLEPYCEAIDSLTQGHCICWPVTILQLETTLWLAREFDVTHSVPADYPYGKTVDAFPPIPYHAFGPLETVVKKQLERRLSIGPLINLSRQYPNFKKLGTFFDELSGAIATELRMEQKEYGANGMDAKTMERRLVEIFLGQITQEIDKYCAEHGVDTDQARDKLKASRLAGIPILHAVITFAVEYYKRHRGSPERGRKPRRSDFLDLHHVRSLPYVDIFSCDAFFAEVAAKAAEAFGARVAPNLITVRRILEMDYNLKP